MSDTLFLDDDDRYSRLRLIAWWDQEKLRSAKILVVGAGALGNEILKNLALLGVGNVWIVDLDTIEHSNLTRSVLFRASDKGKSKAQAAADAVGELNPDTRAIALHANVITDVGLGLFREVDVVIGGLDNREARLWINRACWKVGTPWIDGGIQEINGVAKVFVPPDSACYECAMTENDYRLINLRYSCPLLSREDILAGKVPTAPTISSIIAGLQVQEALKLLHGLPTSAGAAHVFNGLSNQFYTTKYQRRDDCLSHETYPEPVQTPLSAPKTTARQLFGFVRERGESGKLRLELDRDLVVSLDCAACGQSRKVMRPQQKVTMRDAVCPPCGEQAKPRMVHAIAEDDPLASETLATLGVPAFDIVRVVSVQHEHFLLLGGDGEKILSQGLRA
jgi:adenylyltransferase/sulfurtransferase